MPNYGRNLVRLAGGEMEPGEKLKGYLRRVAKMAGIGFRSTEAAWKNQYVSKRSESAFLRVARQKAKNNDLEFIARAEKEIADLEAIGPEFYKPHIAAGRALVALWRDIAENRSCTVISDRNDNGEDGEGNR